MVDGISRNGRHLRINFDVHPSEPLGNISLSQRSHSGKNMALYGKPQKIEIKGYFTKEALRKIRREVSRILLEVELKERGKK
jgi:hypothetical protein